MKQQKKVLIICDLFPPAFGPRMGYLCKYLKPEGWEPVVITENIKENASFQFLSSNCEVHYVDFYSTKNQFVRTIQWIFTFIAEWCFGYKNRKMYRIAKAIAENGKFDLILCSTFRLFPLPAAHKLAKELNLPLVADLRDIIEQYTGDEFIGHKTKHKNFLIRFFTKRYAQYCIKTRNRLLKHTAATTTVSPWHTEFLKRLYQATYRDNHINIMVLDEMNISRVEYYFADFLSILEYPIDQWKLKIMNLPFNFTAPDHLENGILDIAPTTYFIGTANKDDSTYTITDKVYDRAITISFNEQNDYFPVEGETEKITLSYSKLQSLFSEAQNNEAYQLSKDDLTNFKVLTDYIYETFDVTFGNRILNQIILFTPVFVAAGGRKEDALDFMFCRKILNKLDGRFEDYVEQGLENLLDLINKTYSKEDFTLSKQFIKKLLRRF